MSVIFRNDKIRPGFRIAVRINQPGSGRVARNVGRGFSDGEAMLEGIFRHHCTFDWPPDHPFRPRGSSSRPLPCQTANKTLVLTRNGIFGANDSPLLLQRKNTSWRRRKRSAFLGSQTQPVKHFGAGYLIGHRFQPVDHHRRRNNRAPDRRRNQVRGGLQCEPAEAGRPRQNDLAALGIRQGQFRRQQNTVHRA